MESPLLEEPHYHRGQTPAYLSFGRVCQTVTVRDSKTGLNIEKSILNNVTGFVKPSQVLAIMGPSGSGKTTLLSLLGGRCRASNGSILLNGFPFTNGLKKMTGYVPQDDLLLASLTVRESLLYSAELRLPESVSYQQKLLIVDRLLRELGIFSVASQRVGSTERRGISGGERKRVSIGMELVHQPELLLADEPTSGLDSGTAFRIMNLLRKLAHNGRTVACTIHQPSSHIFSLFDQLLLLAQGGVVYFGPAAQVLQHMEGMGFVCPPSVNPADFLLDLTSARGGGDEGEGGWEEEEEEEGFEGGLLYQVQYDGVGAAPGVLPETGTGAGAGAGTGERKEDNNIAAAAAAAAAAGAANDDPVEGGGGGEGGFVGSVGGGVGGIRTPNDVSELLGAYASSQGAKTVLRKTNDFGGRPNPVFGVVALGQCVFKACSVGLLFQHLSTGVVGAVDRAGCVVFILMTHSFSATAAQAVFAEEREVYGHELRSGMYRPWAFYLAKLVCSLPKQLVMSSVFACITYWAVGFQDDLTKFGAYWVVMICVLQVADGFATWVGLLVDDPRAAQAIIPVAFVYLVLFAGFFVNITSIPVWLRWLQYFSFFRYEYSLLLRNELDGLQFECGDQPCPYPTGLSFFNSLHLGEPTSQWVKVGVLACFGVVFRVLGYLALRKRYREPVLVGEGDEVPS